MCKILVTHLPETVTAREIVGVYLRRWWIEVCQTQPIKMAWCPLRRFRRAVRELRGRCKRENEMDVNVFSCHDDFVDQALRDGLALFKCKPFQIIAQQLAKGFGMVNDLLPVDSLLPSVGSLPDVLRNLLQLGGEFLTPRLELTQVNDLGLIGIEHALVLTLDPLPPLEQLHVLRLKRGEVLLFGCGPALMQLWDHAGMS
jgi:hypothetical protein